MDRGDLFAPLYDPLMTMSGWRRTRRRLAAGLSGSVLDVGCGTAAVAGDVADYTGLDRSMAMLTRGRSTRLVCADADAMPFADGTFDMVMSSAFLGLVEPGMRRPILREMGRVCHGHIRIIEPVAPLGPVRRTVALSRHPLDVAELTAAGWHIDAVGPTVYAGIYTLVCATPN